MKSVLLAAAAFLCGVGASYLAFRWIAEPKDDPPSRGAQAHDVRAALKPDDDIPTKDAFDVPVPEGHIPVVVPVSSDRVASNIVTPYTNMRVNVVTSKRDSTTGKAFAVILLKHILVLEDKFESTVTLALKPEDVPVLERARRDGVLSLVLPPFSNKISSDDSSAHFEIPVPPGHVPVVIEASPETLAGVRPTSPRYNVIIVKRDDQGKSRAAILLKNVVVLEEKFDVETDQNGLHRPKHLVTLALKPADVSILERAKQEGVIGLALRPVYPLSDAEASKVIEHAPR